MRWREQDHHDLDGRLRPGLTFTGTFTKTPTKEYVGNFGGITAATGQLVRGAVAGC